MAFGKHWEWRGFGQPSEALVAAIGVLPLKYPTSQELTDHYLWVPGRPINIKLRGEDLKFKRRLQLEGEFEQWLEDEAENYRFPLTPGVFQKLAVSLGASLKKLPEEPTDRRSLLKLLEAEMPSVRLVSVKKSRMQHDLSVAAGHADDSEEPVTVEVARIDSPEPIVSVGIEHPVLKSLKAAYEKLGLAGRLRALSYLDAVATWGSGNIIDPGLSV